MKAANGKKWCFDCKEEKAVTEFGIGKHANDGLNPICKKCNCKRATEYYYGIRRSDSTSVFAVPRPGVVRRIPAGLFAKNLKSYYGIGIRDFWDLWEWQEGVCPVCNEPLDGNGGYNVDHEGGKETNGDWTKVRGIVHAVCNHRIADNTVETAERILDYLKAPPAKETWGKHSITLNTPESY